MRETPPDQSADPPRSVKIMIVDDYADAADSLSQVLQLEGYRTRIAADGPTALEAAADFRPAVALVDIGLPRMDGYEVARRLRQVPGLEETGLIALTGYGQERDKLRAREAGFDEHVVKPVDVALLCKLIERLTQA